jgi:hypothetical protein
MRTKKAEIASQKQIENVERPTVPTNEISDEAVAVDDVPKEKEYQVFVRFGSRENAENFKFKLKSLGYDNAELREV